MNDNELKQIYSDIMKSSIEKFRKDSVSQYNDEIEQELKVLFVFFFYVVRMNCHINFRNLPKPINGKQRKNLEKF